MGTWGAGNFENDWALDWRDDLRENGDASQIRTTLKRVVEHGGTKHCPPSIFERLRGRSRHTNWVTAHVAAEALAAAEIVAAWRGRLLAKLPECITELIQKHSSSLKLDIVPLARQAVNIVRTNSELKDLWEEGDAAEWHQVIQDLDERLQN
jgi:hypothetical protein